MSHLTLVIPHVKTLLPKPSFNIALPVYSVYSTGVIWELNERLAQAIGHMHTYFWTQKKCFFSKNSPWSWGSVSDCCTHDCAAAFLCKCCFLTDMQLCWTSSGINILTIHKTNTIKRHLLAKSFGVDFWEYLQGPTNDKLHRLSNEGITLRVDLLLEVFQHSVQAEHGNTDVGSWDSYLQNNFIQAPDEYEGRPNNVPLQALSKQIPWIEASWRYLP